MNTIKNRQEFRPFAPSVLEEHAHEIFDMPTKKSEFMQHVAPCKFPDKYPAICHIDNTSRVQTVSKKDNPGYYKLIKEFYKKTGCPMVLNTSLNIKGQPIVNDEERRKRLYEQIWRKSLYGEKIMERKEYLVEITYSDSGNKEVETIKTDDLAWSMNQYQRNRLPLTWEICR